jgi:hypothetical protein
MEGLHMKIRICYTLMMLLILVSKGIAQPPVSPDLDNELVRHGVIAPFISKDNDIGSPYLVHGWIRGVVEFKNHKHIPDPGGVAWFNFDKINSILFVADSQNRVIKYPIDSISSIYLSDNDHEYNFEKVAWISDHYFLMPVIKSATGFSLYKRMYTKFIQADFSDGGYYTVGRRSDEYADYYEYYLVYPGNRKWRKIYLQQSVVRHALKNESKLLDEFFSLHADEIDEQSLLAIIQFINDRKYPD